MRRRHELNHQISLTMAKWLRWAYSTIVTENLLQKFERLLCIKAS